MKSNLWFTLLIIFPITSIVSVPPCPLKPYFQVHCYEELYQAWTEFRKINFANFTDQQFRLLQEPLRDGILRNSLLARAPGGIELICRIRTGLDSCLRRENIPYLQRNGKSIICYPELRIEMTLSYLAESIFGSTIGMIDPYSFWAALEPYCSGHIPQSSMLCLADNWPEAVVQLWKDHPVSPDKNYDLSSTQQACLDTRIERVLKPLDSIKTCDHLHHQYLCHLISQLATRLYFHIRFPETYRYCNLHLNCTGCRRPTEVVDNLRELQSSWTREEMSQLKWNPIDAYKAWCNLREDLHSALSINNDNDFHFHCPYQSYQTVMDNFTSYIYRDEKWTLPGLQLIATAACKRTIQTTCLLKERHEFLDMTSDFRSAESLSAELNSHSLCRTIENLVFNFTNSVRLNCGKHTAKVACHSLASDLVEDMYDWRFARVCSVSCNQFEDDLRSGSSLKSQFVLLNCIVVVLSFAMVS